MMPQASPSAGGPSEVPTRPPSPTICHCLFQLGDLLVCLLILLLRNPSISLLPHIVLSLPTSLPASPVAILLILHLDSPLTSLLMLLVTILLINHPTLLAPCILISLSKQPSVEPSGLPSDTLTRTPNSEPSKTPTNNPAASVKPSASPNGNHWCSHQAPHHFTYQGIHNGSYNHLWRRWYINVYCP